MEEKFENETGTSMPSKISVSMIDEVKSQPDPIPTKQKNWSWPNFIFAMVYIVVTVIVGTVAINPANGFQTYSQAERIGYIILMFVAGCGIGALIYNLGKHLFAKLSGYQLSYLSLTGFTWDFSKEKPFSFEPSLILEFHSTFRAKDKDLEKSPVLMSIGGFLCWIVVFAICLGLFASPLIADIKVKQTLLVGTVLSGAYPFYQLIPFRADYPTDFFVLVSTKGKEDREAFNAYYYNRGTEFMDVDYVLPTLSDYNSYWKAKQALYVLKDQLYKADVDDAIKTLTKIHKASRYLNEEERAMVSSERLFLLLLLNDNAGADRLFISLPKTSKTEVLKHATLAGYRNSLMINGILIDKEDASIENVKSANITYPKTSNSYKMKQEKKYYTLAYNKVVKACPTFKIPQLEIK